LLHFTARTNSGLDKTRGQGQKRSAGAAQEKHPRAEPRGRLIVDSSRPRSQESGSAGVVGSIAPRSPAGGPLGAPLRSHSIIYEAATALISNLEALVRARQYTRPNSSILNSQENLCGSEEWLFREVSESIDSVPHVHSQSRLTVQLESLWYRLCKAPLRLELAPPLDFRVLVFCGLRVQPNARCAPTAAVAPHPICGPSRPLPRDRMASPTNSSPRRRRLTPGFDVAKRLYDSGAETGDESDETKGLIAGGAWLRTRA
jgi:hypothetical protein